ncbi:phosphoribosyltransferase domain-containing protein [Planococcus sp. 1R117A]|uniref:phosphoribosyltransferase domain-containing protein n=1 Tax=Planococcus sp. 1R117A TaxID=3447020 RepID=UPI003EDC2059
MKTTNRSMSSTILDQPNYQINYKLWQQLDLSIAVNYTYKGLPVESLFSMALRVNKKRQFLFVSPLIAKHLAVSPAIALGTGTLLAYLLMEDAEIDFPSHAEELVQLIKTGEADPENIKEAFAYKTALPKKTIFIGMAETATGLGHAVFQHFEDAAYIHTTRENIKGLTPSFVFEEEHSHATSHIVYAPKGMFEEAETIVLIDDEISTGNTFVNLIKALDDQFPGKKYKALSILDWRSQEQQEKFRELAESRKIQVDVLALVKGQFNLHHSESPNEAAIEHLTGSHGVSLQELAKARQLSHKSATGQGYLSLTGRFGLTSSEHTEVSRWAEQMAQAVGGAKDGEKPLIIGIGENMYLPIRFAYALSSNALVQTTTRSPIFASTNEDYPIKEKVKFRLPDSEGVDQFLYNLKELDINKIYLLAESVVDESAWQPLLAYLEEKAPVEWISLTTAKRRD